MAMRLKSHVLTKILWGLYERFPEFDDLDDEFMEHEEEYTARVSTIFG